MSNDNKGSRAGKALTAFSRIPGRTKLIIIVVIAIVFIFAFPIMSNIAGNSIGSVVGTAVGTFQAVKNDMPAAYAQGIEDGLSAEDIRVVIQEKVRDIGKLDVLAANAEITDVHGDGDTYKAIYSLGADVIFSVDVSKASVFQGEDQLIIKLPKPVGQINIDSTKTRLEAEWQRFLFDGSSQEGITAYINSMKKIQSSTEKEMNGYNDLLEQAEDSAAKQVKMLAEAMTGNRSKIEIQFEEKAGENE